MGFSPQRRSAKTQKRDFVRSLFFEREACERVHKPSSVLDDHLSRPDVTAQAQAIAKARRAAAYASIPSCIRWGLHHGQVAKPWVSSYLAFPPLPGCPGGISLLHSPWSRLHRPLAGTLPCDARTFLMPPKGPAIVWAPRTGGMIPRSSEFVKGGSV